MSDQDLTSLEARAVAIRARPDAVEVYGELALRVRSTHLRKRIELHGLGDRQKCVSPLEISI